MTAAATAMHPLQLYVGELRQLFDSMDPAPFRERDLDDKAAAYIVDSACEAPSGAALALAVHLGREPGSKDTDALLRQTVHDHFERRAAAKRRELRALLRTGRVSLLIGVVFLAVAIALANFLGSLIRGEGTAWLVKESLIIGGWVALWRPMEIFLYEWWPMRADARLYDRLAGMPVSLRGAEAGPVP